MNKRASSSFINKKRGFTLYLMFLLLFLMIFSGFLSQSIEILALAGMQSDYLSKESKVKPGSTWYLEKLLGPAELE